MKKIIFVCAITMFAALGLGSCIKDKGNYDYTSINAPTFYAAEDETYQRSFKIEIGDSLKVKAPIESMANSNSGDTFSYEWYEIVNPSTWELVSDEAMLKLRVVKDARYAFRVKNNRTGVWYSYNHRIEVSVLNVISRGFVFLTKRGNGISADIYSVPMAGYQTGYTLHKDLFDIAEDGRRVETEDRKGISIVAMNNTYGNAPYVNAYTMFLLTDKSCDMVNTSDFSLGNNIRSAITVYSEYTNEGTAIIPSRMVSKGQGRYLDAGLMWNGNWFWMSFASNKTYNWDNAVNIPQTLEAYRNPVGNEIPVSEHIAILPSRNIMIMWSDQQQKFLVKTGSGQWGGNAMTSLSSLWLTDNNNTAGNMQATVVATIGNRFDVEVQGRTLKWMDSRNTTNIAYAIVNDPGIGYRFIEMTASSSATITKGDAFSFPASSQISNAKDFAIGGNWPYLYYSTTDGRVFAFRLGDSQEETEVTSTVVPAGHELVLISSLSNNYSLGSDNDNYYLYVVTKDPSLPEDSCCTFTVWRRNINDAGLTVATYKAEDENGTMLDMKFPGIGDVVSWAWKAV